MGGGSTWSELLRSVAAELGSEQEARRLVEAASGRSGAELALVAGERVPDRARARLADMVGRRRAGEPLQYVVGSWGFRHLDLMVDRRVLIPRPETEIVVEEALAEMRALAAGASGGGDGPAGLPLRVVDLGTGSGAIALSLALEGPPAEIWATDVSADALAVASANLAGMGGPGATRVRLARGSWFEALPPELAGTLSLVVANPPYIAEGEELDDVVAAWEPAPALWSGPTGLEATAHILGQAPRWLGPGGVVVLEVAHPRAQDSLALARRAGFSRAELRADLAGRDRVLVASRPAGSPTGRGTEGRMACH